MHSDPHFDTEAQGDLVPCLVTVQSGIRSDPASLFCPQWQTGPLVSPGFVLSSYLQLGSPRRQGAVPPPGLRQRLSLFSGSQFLRRGSVSDQPPWCLAQAAPLIRQNCGTDCTSPPTDSCPCWRRRSTGQTLRSGSQASPCHPQRGPSWCPGQVCATAGFTRSLLGLPG